MVTNNKVLTVSYGTFSCTLEGFDDSFDTMKAIAEYFRDLAADDRYFGAEPPTPDAEMLTRIAEREIERRVQARHESGAIVLSAQPTVAQEAPVDVAPDAQAPVEASSVETSEAELPHADIQEDQPDLAPEPITEAAPEEVIEAAVAEIEETPVVEATEPEVSDILDALAQDAQDAPVAETAADMASAEEFFTVTDTSETETDSEYADPIEDSFEDSDSDEDTINLFEDAFADADTSEAAAAPEEDSIAAKLRRIRAVVSRAETAEDDEDDYTEDQHADLSTPIDLGEEVVAAEAVEPVEDVEDEVEEEIEAAAPVVDTPKPRARVIRMKRAQLEEALADEADDDLSAPTVTGTTDPTSTLSEEDEADLMAELAEVDAELAIDTPAEPAPQEEPIVEPEVAETESVEADSPIPSEEEAPRRKQRRERRAKLDAQQPGDEAVDRLIEEANTKLDEPEGNRRRSAIAHLRAAVAATKAEKDAGKSFDKEDVSEAYRDDLAQAVKPRKSAPSLKLVAEQRIDAPEEATSRGVRPRRVSVDAAAVAANEASSNFVEFAENMGATQLPEVMEAAASYLTFVEGRKKFSRPMLMRLAYQIGEERFEREAGLRSFGQLLRDKKIEKLAGGRFTVSDAINFKPDDRAAG